MATLYDSATGEDKRDHFHQLIKLAARDQFGNRYRCRTCNPGLKNLSGRLVGVKALTFRSGIRGLRKTS